MMRVLMVAPRFAPSTGGVETHVREVSRRLLADGVEVEVLTTDHRGDLPAHATVDGVPVTRVRARPAGRDWAIATAIASEVRASDADVIHHHSYQTLVTPISLAAARTTGRPLVVTFHSGGHSSGLRRAVRPAQTLGLAPWLRGAAALIAVSRFEAELFAHRLRIPVSRIRVIPNGSDLPAPSPDVRVDANLVISLGRLERYKGHERAVEALALLARDEPAVRLLILGGGPDEAAIRATAERLGVADRVEIRSIPGSERQAFADTLASAACVVVLSGYESHGIGAWEAVAVGRPVVALDATALHELVEADAATGVAPDAGAGAIADAVRSARARAVARSEGAAPIHVPTWDDCAAAVRAVYAEVTAPLR
jgi:glycosyltransferase involved in cell wall biosynthesis